jgi:DNA-binding GntR family transcriptional regulator
VREAIAKLVEENLVSVFPQAGTFVSPIPFHRLCEALVIRRSLEETSARLAAQHATADDLARLASTCIGTRAVGTDDEEAFHLADDAFHAAIAKMAGVPGLWRVVVQVKVQVDRLRHLTLPQAGRSARIIDEHETILRAVAARDPDAAATAMGAHVGGLLADLHPMAQAHPEYFDMTPYGGRPSTVPQE